MLLPNVQLSTWLFLPFAAYRLLHCRMYTIITPVFSVNNSFQNERMSEYIYIRNHSMNIMWLSKFCFLTRQPQCGLWTHGMQCHTPWCSMLSWSAACQTVLTAHKATMCSQTVIRYWEVTMNKHRHLYFCWTFSWHLLSFTLDCNGSQKFRAHIIHNSTNFFFLLGVWTPPSCYILCRYGNSGNLFLRELHCNCTEVVCFFFLSFHFW